MGHQKITKPNRTAEQGRIQSTVHSALPTRARAEHILILQQTIGNQAVMHLLQTKLKASQPSDEYEHEADLAAEQLTPSSGVSGPQLSPTGSMIQRQKREPTAHTETPSAGLIVEDEAEDLRPGQMRKSEFLSQMRTAVCSAAEYALSGTIWSAMGCPYIDRWFDYYSNQRSRHIERALQKYAPETASVRIAREYIPIVTQRVRRGIAEWTKTGEVSGVPEEFVKGGMPGVTAGGLMGGLVSGALSAVGSAVSGRVRGAELAVSGIGRALFKGREGGAGDARDPEAIRSQLSSGHALDSDLKSRMESAFGVGLSGVRVHTDATAQELSDSLNARAFTIGSNIVFGSGEYKPRTPIGDALIAHELAHVVQQGGGNLSAAPRTKSRVESNSLEEDADVSAVGAVVSVWGGMKGALSDIANNAKPRMRSGLRLQRCSKDEKVEEKKAAKEEPKLLKDFALKFSDAAHLIRKSEAAMKLVREAEAAGAKFGGYAEDGPGRRAWPYTVGDTVYISKARADKVVAMSDFLFELNNAIRAPKFAELGKEAAKGTKGKLTAKEYAYKIVDLEVEGMLRMGEIWFELKKTIGKGEKWDKYDSEFFLSEYEQFKEGKKTKEDIIKDVLKRVRHHEPHKGMTIEQHYMEDYKEFSGGK